MKTEIVYSSQKTGFIKGRMYANPRFFNGVPRAGIKKAIVVGNWPKVVEAYRNAGVEVEIVGVKESLAPAASVEETASAKEVCVPSGYADLSWPEQRTLAKQVSDQTVINRAQATEVITVHELRAEMESLGGKPDRRWGEARLREEIARLKEGS